MARGYPDWYRIKKTAGVVALADLGELAVRLGALTTFDRRGDVIWWDSFDENVGAWAAGGYPDGWSVVQAADHWIHGGQCCKMTTAAGVDYRVKIDKTLSYTVSKDLGMEITIAHDSKLRNWELKLDGYDGSELRTFGLQYHHQNQTLAYLDDSGGWTVFASGYVLNASLYHNHVIKVVADLANDVYKRALIDADSWDLSTYSLYKEVNSSYAHLFVYLYVWSANAAGETVYVDRFILTQNEP